MTDPALGPGPEFDRIRAITRALGATATNIGDDAALVPGAEGQLLISTDMSVEDRHFRTAWLGPEEIGWRSTAGALSDLAAMGARPFGVLVSLAVPAGLPVDEVTGLMRGVGEAAAQAGAKVLGGDLGIAPVRVLDVVVLGRAPSPVWRDGARPGDEVWVSGPLGGARAALAAWQAGDEPDPAARAAFARPGLRWQAGMALAAAGATAMVDLSDGLAGDARHLAAASGVRLELDLDALPLHPAVPAAAAGAGVAAAEFAALGGEDYELLATLPPGAPSPALEAAVGPGLTRIGRVVAGQGVELLLAGRPVTLAGYDHFA